MITVTLPYNYEHDVYALVRSFYPGAEVVSKVEEAEGGSILLEDGFCLPLDLNGAERCGSRLEQKTLIKTAIYGALSEHTGKTLSWGTLTGIRPCKLAMEQLELGAAADEAAKFLEQTYLVSPKKAALASEIASRERALLAPIDYRNGYSLYIGIPFCPSRCSYCSFTGFPLDKWKDRVDEYVDALCRELTAVSAMQREYGRKLCTIYMGGGTPTSLTPSQMDRLLTCVEEQFLSHDKVLEFTVEAGRPDSITEEKLKVLLDHNIGRISINPQTMQQKTLDLIGRKHTVEQIVEAFALARSLGMDNINMDMILGLPGETLSDVEDSMAQIEELRPDSLTVHSLAIKRAARLNTMKEAYADYKIENSDQMVDLTEASARRMGLVPYYLYRQKNMAGNFENVGYSALEKACIYNILIMEEKQTIIACGAGGASKIVYPEENRLERVENVKDVNQYMERLDEMLERKRAQLLYKE